MEKGPWTPGDYLAANSNIAGGGIGGHEVNSLAYSGLPLFVALLVGSLMVLVLVWLSFRKLKSNIPLAGGCSAAISAACHPPEDENPDNAALGMVMWGETTKSPAWATDQGIGVEDEDEDEKGHCCFTSSEAERPLATKLYA